MLPRFRQADTYTAAGKAAINCKCGCIFYSPTCLIEDKPEERGSKVITISVVITLISAKLMESSGSAGRGPELLWLCKSPHAWQNRHGIFKRGFIKRLSVKRTRAFAQSSVSLMKEFAHVALASLCTNSTAGGQLGLRSGTSGVQRPVRIQIG